MDTLNDEQRKAVLAGDGPVVIVAGPGTGKTKTLTARIIHLIESGRAKPQDILALTFTKKAAQEMAARVGRDGPTICTFHALCSSLLGNDHSFVTESDRTAIIKHLSKPSDFKGMGSRELGLLISRAKNAAEHSASLDSIVAAYNQRLTDRGQLDFDDLLLRARNLLRGNPQKRPHFTYILVDEFQDTNLLQYEVLQLLRNNNNLFIIGDPNQSIYGFRGASGSIFDTFLQDFPDAAHITLTANYRSVPSVVTLTNRIFMGGPKLQAMVQGDGTVRSIQFLNEYSEAHWVVGQIQQAIGGSDLQQATHHDAKSSLKDFAIVYRNRYVAGIIQKYIADSGLPYQIVGDGSPYEKTEVATLIALFRCMAGQPTPVEGFTTIQVDTLLQKIDPHLPPEDLAQALVTAFALPATQDITHVIGTFVRFTTVASVLTYIDDIAARGFYDASAEAVTLLTIHASKGLEFPHVFLVGAEDGVLPSANGDPNEERRLFYVAVTRAKQALDITSTTHRGKKQAVTSHFVTDLPDTVLPHAQDPNLAADRRRLQKRHAKKAQTSLF